MSKIFLILSAFILLSSCSTTPTLNLSRSFSASNGVELDLNRFNQVFEDGLYRHDLIVFKRGLKTQVAQAIIIKNKNTIITFLSPLGVELASISISDNNITVLSNKKFLNDEFISRVLSDIYLVFSEVGLLEEGILSEDVSVSNSLDFRNIFSQSQKEIVIHYKRNKVGKIILAKIVNNSYSYEIEIRDLNE